MASAVVTAQIGEHVLSEWLGAGPDGVRYAAIDGRGREVEVRHVHEVALRAERGRRVALLSRLKNAALLRVLDRADDPPHVVLERGLASWEDPRAWPGEAEELGVALRSLASALAEAHSMGIVHGELAPGDVWRKADGYALDLSGVRTMAASPIAIAPELGGGESPTTAADVWSLASIFEPIVDRVGASDRVRDVLASMRKEDPEARPSARLVYERLETTAVAKVVLSSSTSQAPRQLGPYELLEPLGAGGMGSVYRARDVGSGEIVALKILSDQWSQNAEAVARFRREARILSRLHSPHVARFVHANEADGVHYLAMELVDGQSAQSLLSAHGPMSIRAVCALACCVLRALGEVHALGLVHRDVKPGNILVAADSDRDDPRAKLCDFGIARATDATELAVTTAGTIGTPFYMAPEQLQALDLDARVDVYALGATLFELLTGQPPFTGEGTAIILAHVQTPAPDVRTRRPDVPEPLARMVSRALAKAPSARFDDASHFLRELEAWRRGALVEQEALPQPIDLEGTPIVYDAAWELASSPQDLWPHVSNTERLNRAIGLDDVDWMHEDGKREGAFRAAGMMLRWKENPFEWVAPHRLGVVREYSSGPFDWLRSIVDLTPRADGGTTLRHTIEICPRGLLGRIAASVEVGIRMRRALERVYRRIDESCRHARAGGTAIDPFEEQRAPAIETARRLDVALSRLSAAGSDPYVVEALRHFIETAPPQRIARVRPRSWAREQGLDEAKALDVLLRAAHEGVLVPLWDILCPTCRIPSSIHESLRALRDHGRCDACQLDFELDLARSVELVLRVHPSIRPADLGVYCIGGPAHSPHVHAQVRLAPGQRLALSLSLAEGSYRIASRALEHAWRFTVHPRALVESWEVPLASGLSVETPRSLKPGAQRVVLANDLDREAVVRIESTAERSDAFTAADASANALFRALYPQELLSSEQLIGVSKVALLFADAAMDGDERSIYRALCDLLVSARDAAAHEGGALVKLHGDAVLAVFTEPTAAMRAALRMMTSADRRISLHTGPAMMATIQDRLDYFGRTVQLGAALLHHAAPGEIVISDEMACDPGTEELQRTRTRPAGVLRAGGIVAARVRAE